MFILSHILGATPVLLYLHSGLTEAESVLETVGSSAPAITTASVALPLDVDQEWCTLLDIVPSKLVYAAVSKQGSFTLLQLYVSMSNVFTASVLHAYELPVVIHKAVSLCFKDRRYILVQDDARELEFYSCDLSSRVYTVKAVEEEEEEVLLRAMLGDYNTENNVIGFKHNVCYYDKVPIARLPPRYACVAVFGTQCEKFQLLVWNRGTGLTEWWRWTGTTCEAVSLDGSEAWKLKGNLLWF